jgi:hypothetical protein
MANLLIEGAHGAPTGGVTMIWVLILIALAAWLSIVLFFVALCSAGSRAEKRASQRAAYVSPNVIDLSSFRRFHDRRDREPAAPASAVG